MSARTPRVGATAQGMLRSKAVHARLALSAAGLALAAGGCLLAPPRPGADHDAGTDPGGCDPVAELTADDVLPVAIAHPIGGERDQLVRGGTVGARPALLIHRSGPAFSPTRPDACIVLGAQGAGAVVAVAPHGPDHLVAVVGSEEELRLIEVDLVDGSVEQRSVTGLPGSPGSPVLALNGSAVVFGFARALLTTDIAGGVTDAAITEVPPPDDAVLALVDVDTAATGHGWIATGLGADYTINLGTRTFVGLQPHGPDCSATVQTGCAPRHARAVTSSRLASGDQERLVAVSIGDDQTVLTLQNRGAPRRDGTAPGLPRTNILDVEVTDLPASAQPRLFVLAGDSASLTLSYMSVVFRVGASNLLDPATVAQLPVDAMDGPLRVVTGRFVTAATAYTVVLGRAKTGLAASCYESSTPAKVGC